MNGPIAVLIAAVVGCTFVVVGGAVGLWRSLRQARSTAERRYLLAWSAGCFAGIGALLAALAFLSDPYRWLVFVPYTLALGWAIRRSGSDLMRIRASEGRPTP